MSNVESQEFKQQVITAFQELPGVTVGRRFGGEAFFYKGKFFAHLHPAGRSFFLETWVWKKVDDVVREIPAVIPHPEYAGYGWVRLPVSSNSEVVKAQILVEKTYRYLRTTKRIALRKARFTPELLAHVQEKMPQVKFATKEARKTVQVMMEAPELIDYHRAEESLSQAASMLRKGLKD